jgi:opacity protein-like surface antigen
VQIDTQYFPKPVPYKVEVRDTVYLDKPYTGHVFTQETKWFSDNSTYDMQVSGINVELDYIKTFPKTEVQYITTTEYVREKPKKWGIGVIGGYGIGGSGFQPYIGFGISYDIIQF